MHNRQIRSLVFRVRSRAVTAALALAILLALTVILTQSALAQTFNVIHNLTGGHDGGDPTVGLTLGGAGSLYGTTYWGCGTVFELTPSGGGWTHTLLHDFTCGADGAHPVNVTPIFDANGSLYGTATGYGLQNNGTVWEITQ